MRVSGIYAVYRGREYAVVSFADSYVNLSVGDAETGELPDEIGRGVRTRGEHKDPWVKVPRSSLDLLYSLRVWGTWRGEKIQVTADRGGELGFAYLGSSEFAREQGMVGDQQAGYVGTAPTSEVQDLREERTELALNVTGPGKA